MKWDKESKSYSEFSNLHDCNEFARLNLLHLPIDDMTYTGTQSFPRSWTATDYLIEDWFGFGAGIWRVLVSNAENFAIPWS